VDIALLVGDFLVMREAAIVVTDQDVELSELAQRILLVGCVSGRVAVT